MDKRVLASILTFGMIAALVIPGCETPARPTPPFLNAYPPGGVPAPQGSAAPAPAAAATPFPLSHEDFVRIAFKHISETYGIPIADLESDVSDVRNFLLTNVAVRHAVVHNNKSRKLPSEKMRFWSIAVDAQGRVFDYIALDNAENVARANKYGKTDPLLWGQLEKAAPGDLIDVTVGVKGLDPEAIRKQVQKNYPDLYFGPIPPPTRVPYDAKRWQQYETEVSTEIIRQGAALAQPLIDYIKSRGYDVELLKGSSAVTGRLPKWFIEELKAREDVAGMGATGGISRRSFRQNIDTASPSDGAPGAWQRQVTGLGRKIGIADSDGVNPSNPYLAPRVHYVHSPTPAPAEHPTNVAGVAASSHPRYKGIAPQAEIYSAHIGYDPPLFYQQATFELIDPTVEAKVVNLSWGADGNMPDLITSDLFYDWVVRHRRVSVVATSGNMGQYPLYSIDSPGKGYNVITVGGYTDNDTARWNADAMWPPSSSKNLSSRGNEKPELVAVGQSVYTTSNQAPWITSGALSGTSLAAPQVTGAIASLFHRKPSLEGKPEAIKAILMASAIHNIEGSPVNQLGVDDTDGAGAIDLELADYMAQFAKYQWAQVNLTSDFPGGWYTTSPEFWGAPGKRVRVAINWDSNVPADYWYFSNLDTRLYLEIHRLDQQGQEVELVATSLSDVDNFQLVDFYPAVAANYRAKVFRAYSSETSNYLGIAWLVTDQLYAYTSLDQEVRAADESTFAPVFIDSVTEPRVASTYPPGNAANVPGGIRRYVANATYPGLDPDYDPPHANRHPVRVIGVEPGDYPFDHLDSVQIDDDQGRARFYYTTWEYGYQAPLKLARMGLSLDGSAKKAYDLYLVYDILAGLDRYVGVQTAYRRQYQRGDAKEDFDENPENDVDMNDAMFIAQYRVGIRPLSDLNAVNAASPQHNEPYDKIDMNDALFISQYRVNLRDEFFDWVEASSSAYATRSGGEAVLETGSLQLGRGYTGRVPITLRNITGKAGVGAYEIRVTFDPGVIRVDSVDGGPGPLGKPAAFRIDNGKGIVSLAGFDPQIPGVTKDSEIAYLNISAVGPVGRSTTLGVSVNLLSDSLGNNVAARLAAGGVSIR
ncbi:MAG: S8 family serine peptidase [Chloroflexi bacterium]|nr:S8 family serine peptidase [Chloroflexota bacterium]